MSKTVKRKTNTKVVYDTMNSLGTACSCVTPSVDNEIVQPDICDIGITECQLKPVFEHIENEDIHVTLEDKERWDHPYEHFMPIEGGTFTGPVKFTEDSDVSGTKITNLGDPENPGDAVNLHFIQETPAFQITQTEINT